MRVGVQGTCNFYSASTLACLHQAVKKDLCPGVDRTSAPHIAAAATDAPCVDHCLRSEQESKQLKQQLAKAQTSGNPLGNMEAEVATQRLEPTAPCPPRNRLRASNSPLRSSR